MTSALKVLLPAVVVASLLGPVVPASAATSSDAAVVDLTFDVTSALFAEDELSQNGQPFLTQTISRPTSAPLPPRSVFAKLGITIAPGTTIAISVFSSAQIHDGFCVTGTSSKTKVAVYLSSKGPRPTLTRPHGCSLPGSPPTMDKPSAALVAMQHVTDLKNDLRIVSISEESYATDYDGAYVADTLDRRGSKPLPRNDVLVKQGASLTAGDRVIATLFRTATGTYDDYCLTGTSTTAKAVFYLSSVNNVVTSHRPQGCVAPTG